MKIKNIFVIFVTLVLLGGLMTQEANAAVMVGTYNCETGDSTFPGCQEALDQAARRAVGTPCGSNNGGSCTLGSGACTGANDVLIFGGTSCPDGTICCGPTSNYNGVGSGSSGATSGLTPESNGNGATSGLTPESNGSGSTTTVGTGVYIPTAEETGLPGGTIKGILKNLLTWMLEIVGVIALIGFVISGTQYVLASGDEKLAETAKKNMTYAIIGMVVVLSSFVVIKAIDYALRAQSSF